MSLDEQENSQPQPPVATQQRDQRAIIQADKLRTEMALKALRYGQEEPLSKPRTVKVFFASVALGAIGIVVTIGAATIIQML